MRKHRARGENFDQIDAVVSQLTNSLAHLPWTVGFAVVQVPGKLYVGGLAGHGSSAPGNRDVRARDVHSRAGHVAAYDGIAQSDIVQRAVGADIAHRGESRVEHFTGVGHGFEHDLRRGFT